MPEITQIFEGRQDIKYGNGKDFIKDAFKIIHVYKAIYNGNVFCKHCLKELKVGKAVFISKCLGCSPPYVGQSDDEVDTFCSANHARIYAKKNDSF